LCAAGFVLSGVRQHFYANFLKVSNFLHSVKREPYLIYFFGSCAKHTALRNNIKDRPAYFACAAKARERTYLSGHYNGLFSAGFPTGIRGAIFAASSDPKNCLLTSLSGQALNRPPEGSTALYCNFLRLAQAILICNLQPEDFLSGCASLVATC
jgi:hypothetical protein